MYESDDERRDDNDIEVNLHEALYFYTTEDCVDWMASNLSRQFPGVKIEVFDATEWRRGLQITIANQAEHTIAEVEAEAFGMRDRLFFSKDVLIALRISRSKED